MSNFDDADRLNDDGSVTLRIIPSNWHRANMSPDTYQTFTGDSWVESELEWIREETGRDLGYDDIEWKYDHDGIVRGLAGVLADWIGEQLVEAGLESTRDVRVIDNWSPQYYNFTTDGFEMEFTCDPAELRALTPDFDVDTYGREVYASYDGFRSYVPGRLNDPSWHADYDGEFRVESLLADQPEVVERNWIYTLAEIEWEVYQENVEVILPPAWGEECPEMDEYARQYNHVPGQLALTH